MGEKKVEAEKAIEGEEGRGREGDRERRRLVQGKRWGRRR